MKKSKKIKFGKILLVSVIVLLFIFCASQVTAAINDTYVNATGVSGAIASTAAKDSKLLTLLAKLVFALGTGIEWLTSLIFQSLTGTNDFPWADRIVFNAVPLLDVNFINPNEASFLGNDDIIKVIRNLYSTILALAVSFFGITVMITSIKLVISTIAEEKAKYKKAVTDWLVGFVMLFCIHFLISFIFYLNESLVKVASQIAVAQYGEAEKKIKAQNSEFANQIIKNVGNDVLEIVPEGSTYYGKPIAEILTEVPGMLEAWTNFAADDNTYGLHEMLMKKTKLEGLEYKDARIEPKWQIQRLGFIFAWALDENIYIPRLQEIANDEIIVYRFSPNNNLGFYNGQAITLDNVNEIFGEEYGDILNILEDAMRRVF